MSGAGAMEEDRDHRIAQVGRDLEWSSSPTSCSKFRQGSLGRCLAES